MSNNLIKRTAVALAVTSAMCASAQANDFSKYNLAGKKLIKASAVTKKEQKVRSEATSWLIKLNAPASINAKTMGADVASIQAQAKIAQASVEQAINSMDLPLQVVAKTSTLVSSVVVNGNKQDVAKLLSNSQVEGIYPVYDYELHVADSADYIEATPLVSNGLATGEGVRVAVLDTGIDYTHTAFGGAGTDEAYAAAIADPASVDWPQGKVLGGYDYINYDDDPIDVTTNHGTHVSHSVNGIAPNVDLFVYSVCNSGCPGLAQLLALESAMDPDGNGDISDRVDVINMSLGGDYGDIANDAVGLFINQAVKLGTNVVISAGNDGAYPFIVGGPSTTENALSVGAMTHPTGEESIGSGTVDGEEAIVQPASFGPQMAFNYTNENLELVYPDANQTACEAFADDVDFTGKGVIIDRGACAFTVKVLAAQAKGAEFVIIANNSDDGTPAPMGGSDPTVTIPSVGVTFAAGTALKAGGTFNLTVERLVLSGAIADFTSRGPSMGGLLKPEITAPGVNIMTAHPGLGDGLTGATGTSFSGPITAGAVSLLKEALPERNAFEIKATLMNTANLNVTMEPLALNPDAELAPISYIGAGLVDVNKAANLPVAAWAADTKQAALSFGLVNASETVELTKTVQVKNFSNEDQVYTLSLEQRYADDVERGSFSLDYPESITVPAGQTMSFDVTATIDPATLPEWTLTDDNIGSQDATADLTNLELDGALIFSDGSDEAFHLVYHVLPKANAAMSFMPVMTTDNGVAHELTNTGAVALEPIFAPTVMTDDVDEDQRFDLVGASIETFAVSTDICDSGYVTLTTLVMNEGITHSYVGGFMADFDVDQDGTYDVTVQNGKLEWFYDVEPGTAITFTHGYGSSSGNLDNIYQIIGNNHLTMQSCLGAFGLTADDIGRATANVRFRTEEATWTPIASGEGDVAMGTYTFTDASSDVYAALVDESGEVVSSLEPGASATLLNAGADFMILSDSGSKAYAATPSEDADVAPVLDDASFSVDENTAVDTVIGTLEATYGAELANPIAEYIVVNSTSSAVSVTASGDVVVMNSDMLDYDAGMMSIELEVVAVDSAGNISESAMVTVEVMNVADEPEEVNPVIDAELGEFSVQENAAEGTVIGTVTATDPDADLTPIATYEVTGSDSISISDAGELMVAGAIDYEQTTSIEVSVTAVDSAGNMSEAVTITIAVTQDPAEDVVAEEPEKKKSSSGSLAWLTLLAAPFAFMRRRKQK
ncbi:S8 family serine peptidase [Pseudoalteromonas shioyasakiensis]|uniref:S8 family serine peptidase n=1 Tax=Pseudoalteromonas shioyasakiensis TaxID=1190813 RepID=UPI002551DC3E|nr:S8 family serine peptidase [Pseudoalteromonas shioyasakiensis]MDK9685319.1 S8 family serine peptidase [Pseudoalteromonas shioyasakiensis]